MDLNADNLVIYDTGPPTKTRPAPIPDKIAGPNPHVCERCNRPFTDDIFCNQHGPMMGVWYCDDCATEIRRQGMPMEVVTALYKKPMDERLIRTQIDIVEHAINALAEIKWVESNDAAGSYRNVDLNLDFRESRVVYKVLLKVLRYKLGKNASFPA